MDCEQIESNHIAERYLMKKLEPLPRAEFEIHFTACPRCADLLLEVQDFCEALKAVKPEFERRQVKSFGNGKARPSRLMMFAAAAALVLVCLVSLAFLWRDNRRLQEQLSLAGSLPAPLTEAESAPEAPQAASPPQEQPPGRETDKQRATLPSAPQINTPIFVLNAVRGQSAENGATNQISVGASPWFVLSLELENRQFDNYRATVFTPDRRIFWKSSDLRPDGYDAITIGCTADFFRAGDYLLVLEGRLKSDGYVAVASYPFRVARKKK